MHCKSVAIIFAGILMGGCQSFLHRSAAGGKVSAEENQLEPAIHLEFMDMTVHPQDDFYAFVNGNWNRHAEIPADRSRWGAFSELRKRTDSLLLDVLEREIKAQRFAEGSDQKKALDYFETFMDTVSRNRAGVRPLKSYLDKIDQIRDPSGITDYVAEVSPVMLAPFWRFGTGPHMKDSKRNTLYLSKGALGLPGKDYYLSEENYLKEIREKYVRHIARMLEFLPGYSSEKAGEEAQSVMKVETALARGILSKEERRRPEKRYNPRSMDDLSKEAPSVNWKSYFAAVGIETDSLILTQPNYLKVLDSLLTNMPMQELKAYLRWTLLRGNAGRLSEELGQANWEFYGKTLRGTPERRPIRERALDAVNGALGEAVGQIYTEHFFPPEAKTKAKELVGYLQQAYIKRIGKLTWMQAVTKEKAIEKVKSLLVKIGYPDNWKDYSAMKIKSKSEGGTYFENSLNASRWHFKRMVEKLYHPPDRTEWGMTPQTVNAYYNPSYNEIVFPAAILQPPFFNFHADAAVNFGGIGAVIGHEISHGFDDQGAKYDAEGNFKLWWTKKDFETFKKLGEKLAKQYDTIEVLPGLHINGTYTLGENIGDLGGVNSAFTALKMYWKDHGKPGRIDGFTPEQRYFISWAAIWRTKMRKEALEQQIETDPHSPGKVRAYQPLRNMDTFHEAFDIRQGDKMYLKPGARVKIW